MVRASNALVATKWVGLSAAIWVQASAGNAYMFAFYSPTLKYVLSYNQVQLNNLGVAKDFGENVGLLAGVLCNKLPPWTLLCTGALCGFVGYGSLWLVVSGQIAPIPYWQMFVLQCIASNSATWFNTAVLVTCMRNFPHSRGTVVGILKGFVGLSAAIFAQFYTALLSSDASQLLLFLAVAPTVVCLASMLFVRPVSAVQNVRNSDEHKKFDFITAMCITLAGYLLIITFIERMVVMNDVILIMLTVVMVLFLAAPLAIPVKILSGDWFGITQITEDSLQDALEPLLEKDPKANAQPSNPTSMSTEGKSPQEVATSTQTDLRALDYEEKGKNMILHEHNLAKLTQEDDDPEILLAVGEGAVKKSKRRPRRGEDFNLRQALVKADFWLLFFTFFCGVGSGVTVINNLGQIGEAQGYYNINIFISLFSIANFLGRLGGGSLSEHYVRSDALPRPLWMGIAQIILIFVHLIFASALPGTLYVGSILLGLCYGFHFSIMVPTASELFGLKHFGMIYNFLTIASPLGSFLFSGLIAGYLYDIEAAKDSGGSQLFGKEVCNGAHCFRLTFYVMAAVSASGALMTTVLTYRIRSVYFALYRKSPHPSASDLKSLE